MGGRKSSDAQLGQILLRVRVKFTVQLTVNQAVRLSSPFGADVLYFQSGIRFHGTSVNVIWLQHVRELRPCLRRYSRNSQVINRIMCRSFTPNFIKLDNKFGKCGYKFIYSDKSGIAHSRPTVMEQSLISLPWTSLEMNVARIRKKNVESMGKIHFRQHTGRNTFTRIMYFYRSAYFHKVTLLDDCLWDHLRRIWLKSDGLVVGTGSSNVRTSSAPKTFFSLFFMEA